jgi:glycosyltransferase involved in cell wall biosynthesis
MKHDTPQPADRAATPRRRFGMIWEGPLFAHQSFANVNREVAGLLARRGDVELGLVVDDASDHADGWDHPRDDTVTRLIGRRPDDVAGHVRHRWPPDFARPQAAGFVLAQPWESTQVPVDWVAAIATSVDELWVPSAFCRDAFVRSGVEPSQVSVVPYGVNPEVFNPNVAPWPLTTERGFRFLFVGGAIERKGFDLLLRAYVREFTSDDDVCLVVKDFHYGGHAGAVVRDLARHPRTPEIRYSYGTAAPEQLGGLFTACDCYVHPYRGEGFGLPIVEAMACALPVIVTGAGPAAEYCTDDTAYLVHADEVPVPEVLWHPALVTAEPPHWYEPDVGHLRALMRHAYEHREEGRRKGALASGHVLDTLTWTQTVDAVVARIGRWSA